MLQPNRFNLCRKSGYLSSFHSYQLPIVSLKQKTGTRKGVIRSVDGKPIAFATVTLTNENNKAIITDSLGLFIVNINSGTILNVSAVGYKDKLFKTTESDSLIILMEPDTKNLKEVAISSTISKKNNNSNELTITNQQIVANTMTDFKTAENLSSGNSYTEHAGLKSSLDNTHTMIGNATTGNLYMGSAVPVFLIKKIQKEVDIYLKMGKGHC